MIRGSISFFGSVRLMNTCATGFPSPRNASMQRALDRGANRPVGLAALDDLLDRCEGGNDFVHLAGEVLAARHLEDEHPHEIRIAAPGAQQDLGDLAQLLPGWVACLLDALDRLDQRPPGLTKDAPENVLLRLEVVVEQPVGDACLLCDVAHAARVVALAREDPHRCVEEQSALVFRRIRPIGQRG